jgi:hypothetical protein
MRDGRLHPSFARLMSWLTAKSKTRRKIVLNKA